MIDITATIYSYLHSGTYWVETNPAYASLNFKFDEYDSNNPNLQILLENLPDKKSFVREDLQKVEHRCKISIFVKPVDPKDDTISSAAKTVFNNMKTQIDKIIAHNLLTNSSFTTFVNTTLDGWNDGLTLQRGRGTKNFKIKDDVLKSDSVGATVIFQSAQIVTCWYYVYVGASTDGSKQPIFVRSISLGKSSATYTWYGITDAKWEDNNPWELIEIPAGAMVRQHIHPVHLEGEIICRDFATLYTALYNTVVNTDSNNVDHKAIDANGTKWNIGYFVMVIAAGQASSITATFANPKIKSVSFDSAQLGKDNMIKVKFTSEGVQYS
jgi:hypothetical protein